MEKKRKRDIVKELYLAGCGKVLNEDEERELYRKKLELELIKISKPKVEKI